MVFRFFQLLFSSRPDFLQFYEAGKMVSLGLNPYEKLLTSLGPFNYPPAILPFLSLFSKIPLNLAAILWNCLSLFSLLTSLYLLIKITKLKIKLLYYIVIYLLTFFFFPVKFTLGMGQINHFILLFIVLGLYHYQRKNYLLAGISFSLASSFKLSPFLILIYLIFKKDRLTVKYFLLTTIILFLLPFFFLSFSSQKIYYTDIFFRVFKGFSGKEIYYNQALSGFVSRTFFNLNQTGKLAIYYLLDLILVLVTLIKLKKLSLGFQWSAVFSLMVLINPLSWQHHLVFLIPCFFLLSFASLRCHSMASVNGFKESYSERVRQRRTSRRIPCFFLLFFAKKLNRFFGVKKSYPERSPALFSAGRSRGIIFTYGFLFFAYLLLAFNLKNPESYQGIIGKLFLSHGFFGNLILWFLSLKFAN